MIKNKFLRLYKNTRLTFSESYESIRRNYRLFCIALAIGLIFVFVYGFVSGSYLSRINVYVQAIGTVAISANGLNGADPASSIMAIFLNSQTKPYLYSVLFMILLLSISYYIMLSTLFASSTYISQCLGNSGKFDTHGLKLYLQRSFITNISWIIILLFLNVISFYLYFISTVSKTIGISQNGPSQLFDSLAIVICIYFFLISISIGQRRNLRATFSLGIRKILSLLPFYIILMFGLVILSYLGLLISKTGSVILVAIYEALIVLSYLIFMLQAFKTYLDKVVSE